MARVTSTAGCTGPEFIDQGQIAADEERYYEQIIYESGVIPTREDSWHDLFNALIWHEFPLTKRYLNTLHMQDIREYGVHPRTSRRHRLTHFDECGVVLAVPRQHLDRANRLLQALADHQWEWAFLECRKWWGEVVIPVMFGHANLEMLLEPFIGLTGKWLAVTVGEEFVCLGSMQQQQMLDVALKERIQALEDFQPPHILKPLPLLGVPHWYPQQQREFYANSDYFRPLRPGRPATSQLPLD
ncbi:DUF3025 domain-containing protein [Alteromonas aestuariivivens]|uniref:DUF3025 domain-containing protein n=2 Tax=Alteromonas aestuariivivens TaxID=1938339 RepID=A0A3D8M694_9ALTE|nr:DUF3025 domain-containing protein [Alteromonas aestuariivivens]